MKTEAPSSSNGSLAQVLVVKWDLGFVRQTIPIPFLLPKGVLVVPRARNLTVDLERKFCSAKGAPQLPRLVRRHRIQGGIQ